MPGCQRLRRFARGWPKFKTRSRYGCLKLMIFMAIASIPASNEGTTEFPAHFEQVNAAKGVTLRHFGQLCYEKVDKCYWLSFSLNKVNRYSHINSNKKKEIHCPSVSLTKWRLRTIQQTLTVSEHNGGMMFNRTSGSLLNTPSLQCVLFCAGRQSVNLMKRVIFLWLSVTK